MPGRTRWAAAAALALVPLLAACSATSTPEPSGAGSSTSEPPPPPSPPTSDDKGRHYDLGAITKVETVSGVRVVVLDRWTVKGLSDTALARDGVPIAKYRLAKSPYINQNTTVTFRIPVTEDPVVVLRHCVGLKEPLQAKSVTLTQLEKAATADRIVLVGLDERGWLVSAQNLPGC